MSPAEIARRARTPEAWAKRRETLRWKDQLRREDVAILRRRGLVPLAIGPALGIPDRTIARYLRELERAGEIEPLPPYLTLTWSGPRNSQRA
jgi:hypothetical protein